MKRIQDERPKIGLLLLTAGALSVLLAAASQILAAPGGGDDPIKQMSVQQFCATSEALVNNIVDLDVRRFTLFSRAPGKASFRTGVTGIRDQKMSRVPGRPRLYFYEVILITRLETQFEVGDDGIPQTVDVVTQFTKFTRRRGGAAESVFADDGIRRLSDVIKIRPNPGCADRGEELSLGVVQNRRILVTVE